MRIRNLPILIVCAMLGGLGVSYLASVRDPGEPILESRTARLGVTPSTTNSDDPWLREVSIQVDWTVGLSGAPKAGDLVSVFLLRTHDGHLVSNVLLRAIKVIAVEQPAGAGPPSQPPSLTVTVEVDTIQAQELALAQQVGTLSLGPYEARLVEKSTPRARERIQRGPYRADEMPLIPYGDYTEPPGGGVIH